MSESSQQRVGQYNFLRILGAGRIAEVYLGRIDGAEGFQKPVAIKKILPKLALDPAFVQSLIAEAKIGGQLHHRNIVEVYDFIRYDDEYCIIMEYVEGVDLSRILRAAKQYRIRIPPAAALYIVSQLCDGLDYAHAARGFSGEELNIIHRDLKPSNILISTKGGVKIGDFGVARVVEQALQRIGTFGGSSDSLYFQSPEQASGSVNLTPASDIFSAGAVFFELLTLEPLFPGENIVEGMANLKERDIAKRLALAQRALPGSEKILATALHPNPNRRYRSASLMGEDIRRLLAYLRVDDPRERLISFFWRLVRFIREKEEGGDPAVASGETDSQAQRDQAEAWSPMTSQVHASDLDAEGEAQPDPEPSLDEALPGEDEHTPVEPIDYRGDAESQGTGAVSEDVGATQEAFDPQNDYDESGFNAPASGGGDADYGSGGYDDDGSGHNDGYDDDGSGHSDGYGENVSFDDSTGAVGQQDLSNVSPDETVLGGYQSVDSDAPQPEQAGHSDETAALPDMGEAPYDPNATYLAPGTSAPPPGFQGATADLPVAGELTGEMPEGAQEFFEGDEAPTTAAPVPDFGVDAEEEKKGGSMVKAAVAAVIILFLGVAGAFLYWQSGGGEVEPPPVVVTTKDPGTKLPPVVLTPTPTAVATPTEKPVAVARVTGNPKGRKTVRPPKATPRPPRRTPTPTQRRASVTQKVNKYTPIPVAKRTPTPTAFPTPTRTARPTAIPSTPTPTLRPTPTPTRRPTPTIKPVKATPPPVAVAKVDTRSAEEILNELFASPTQVTQRARKGQLTPTEIGALASVPVSDEDKYTRSRSFMALHYKGAKNMSEYGKALDAMMKVPSNAYNPVIQLEQAEYYLGQRQYAKAIKSASVAERYRQKFPKGETYYISLARTYEVLAKSYEGKFTSSENPEDIDQSIRMWERYLTHVERKGDAKRTKMAKEYIEKLQRIKERVL